MEFRNYFLILALALFISSAYATSHYSFEHAEEMRLSGRIEWRDYGPEAFQEAMRENKPIFLLLTAPSWCYWCHVYTSDDYIYNPEIYPLINQYFVPIYVDADKRQDLTRQYLEGGWPSTTVLTPNRERLFGYSGPRTIENMKINLEKAVVYVKEKKFPTTISYTYEQTQAIIPDENQLNALINSYSESILENYDEEHGGFGEGQKFPQQRTLDFVLELYEDTGNIKFLGIVAKTLENQYTKLDEIKTNYNLFDPVEGGFHRYGTQRDWTPPHYEKMLYDNAKFVKTYAHLYKLQPFNRMAKEVLEKTMHYMVNNWYDGLNGGFYANTDADNEAAYYGKLDRSIKKPRIEKTKYTEWNSEAVFAFLYLFEFIGDEVYKTLSSQTIEFFDREMLSELGAYHYINEAGVKDVRGNLLDNAYLLLAFVEGYRVFENEIYLNSAEKLANYSLDNLYDWQSSGFFERNSPDKHLYAPGEYFNLSKPPEENGVIAYALLKLYKYTGNLKYLGAGIKAFAANFDKSTSLDGFYYFAKSAKFILENNLLEEFNLHKEKFEEIENQERENFWLNSLLEKPKTEFESSEEGLEKLNAPLLLLIAVALFAGFISFASPCSLPIIPAYLAYSLKSSKHKIQGMTIAFFLGLALVFTLLGMTTTVIGNFLKTQITLFSQIAGVAIMAFGIFILSGKGFSGVKIKKDKPKDYTGSFIFGAAFALSWTPCVGPILVAVLLLASTSSSVFLGGLLLFTYAIGLALPLVLISTHLKKINKRAKLWKLIHGKELKFIFGKKEFVIHSSSLISGLLFLLLGYLMFSGALYSFNQFAADSALQKWILSVEDWLLQFIG